MASASKSTTLYAPASSSYAYTLSVSFTETGTSVASNYSSISVTATLSASLIAFSVTGGGTLAIYWHDNLQNTDVWLNQIEVSSCGMSYGSQSVSGSINATHKDDGSLSGYAYAKWIKNKTNSYIPASGGVTTDWTALTSIARASTFNSVSGAMSTEGSFTLSITKKSTSFYNRVIVKAGSTTVKTINNVANGISSHSFTASEKNTIYSAIGTNTSTTLTFTLYTYTNSSYSTQVGSPTSKTATVSIPSYSINFTTNPTAVDSISTYDNFKTNSSHLIRYLSKPTITFAAASSTGSYYGRTLAYYNSANAVITSPVTLSNFDGTAYSVKASDGRKSNTKSISNTIIPYVIPTIIGVSVARNNPTGNKANISITAKIYNGNNLTNLLTETASFVWQEEGGTETTTPLTITEVSTTDNVTTINCTATLTNLNYTKQLTYQINLTDRVGYSIHQSGSLVRGLPVWNAYDKNGTNYFNVNGKLTLNDMEIPGYDVVDTW